MVVDIVALVAVDALCLCCPVLVVQHSTPRDDLFSLILTFQVRGGSKAVFVTAVQQGSPSHTLLEVGDEIRAMSSNGVIITAATRSEEVNVQPAQDGASAAAAISTASSPVPYPSLLSVALLPFLFSMLYLEENLICTGTFHLYNYLGLVKERVQVLRGVNLVVVDQNLAVVNELALLVDRQEKRWMRIQMMSLRHHRPQLH